MLKVKIFAKVYHYIGANKAGKRGRVGFNLTYQNV